MRALDEPSPIGVIPKTYPFLDLLCQKASIAWRDQSVTRFKDKKTKEIETVTIRLWNVVSDEKPSRDGRGRLRFGSTRHTKFVALQDYVIWRCDIQMQEKTIKGKLKKEHIWDFLLEKVTAVVLPDGSSITPAVDRFKKKTWLETWNEIAREGCPGYDERITKQKSSADLIEDF